jgi:hypothetical protein
MATVIHVIPVIHVVHINVVGFIPGSFPVFRPRINHTEPEAAILESRISAYDENWSAAHAKPVSTAKMRAEAIVWNTIAPVTSAFAPTTMFMPPIVRAMALPYLSRFRVLPVFGPARLAQAFAPMGLRRAGMLPV